MRRRSRPDAPVTTILFTDLADSTQLMLRIGDAGAQHIFETHHRILSEAVRATGGEALQWMGDGMMAAFGSPGDAVRCAIEIQHAAARHVGGERLRVRVGLNLGEVLRQPIGSGYFGTPVVVARRLCDRAQTGQILCTRTVADVLAGRHGLSFRDVSRLALKGISEPVTVCEVLYSAQPETPFLARTPFVGRVAELSLLMQRLQRSRAGEGGITWVVGELGIGKTRLLEEFRTRAALDGARVAWGRCYESEAPRPYGPFAEIVAETAETADEEMLRNAVARGHGVIAQLVPGLRERLRDLPEPPVLPKYEERQRLLDAVTRFLLSVSQQEPLLLVLDDLHWADEGTVALLQHLARYVKRERILVVGAYRDVELDSASPLSRALEGLKRETDYERIVLGGLDRGQVEELLQTLAGEAVPEDFVATLHGETAGHPFFIRELLLHLVEEGVLQREGGRWSSRISIEELGIPEGVRQVIDRRLSRLSEAARRLLRVAAGFGGAFRLDVTAQGAKLGEREALDALDEALGAHLLRPADEGESYEFSHSLIRHTLYTALSPSRRLRLHRRLAEEMERTLGDGAADFVGEIAHQYHQSAALPGAAHGVEHCMAAADRAEQAAAHGDAATFLRMALDLLSEEDARRPRVLARLGLALIWNLSLQDAEPIVTQAAEAIGAAHGGSAAAAYLADAADAAWSAALNPCAWRWAERGLGFAAGRHDLVWARLVCHDLSRREALDPECPGIPLETPERREISRIVLEHGDALRSYDENELWRGAIFRSRRDVLERAPEVPTFLCFLAGEYGPALDRFCEHASSAAHQGRIAAAATAFAYGARIHSALGDLAASRAALARAQGFADRVPDSPFLALLLGAARAEYAEVRGEGLESLSKEVAAVLEQDATENHWVMAAVRGFAAWLFAELGRSEEALASIEALLPAVERAPGWVGNYTPTIHRAVAALWRLRRPDHAATLERNLREKTLGPDFRYPHTDARLSLARLAALQGRRDEATACFEAARRVLEAQGARPLRAVVDLDEAWMRLRSGASDARTASLLEAARAQFRRLDLPGWIRRTEALRRELAA